MFKPPCSVIPPLECVPQVLAAVHLGLPLGEQKVLVDLSLAQQSMRAGGKILRGSICVVCVFVIHFFDPERARSTSSSGLSGCH